MTQQREVYLDWRRFQMAREPMILVLDMVTKSDLLLVIDFSEVRKRYSILTSST